MKRNGKIRKSLCDFREEDKYMQKNFNVRKDVIFFCGVCDQHMRLVSGKFGLFRRCPKYEFANRSAGESVCMNRMSMNDLELMYEELEDMQKKGYFNAGTSGKGKHMEYKIAEITPEFAKVWVINTKKIKLGE